MVIRSCSVCGSAYCMSEAAARIDDGYCVRCAIPIMAAEEILRDSVR